MIKKLLNIAGKDLRLVFRDPGALMLMLVTPMALTLVMGFAFGGLGGQSDGGLADIPVVLVNRDEGELGQNLVEVFRSEDLVELMEPEVSEDEAAARQRVDDDQAAAAVIIPPELTRRVIPRAGDVQALIQGAEPAVVEVYANPTRPVSANVVRAIVDGFLSRVNAGATGGRVAVQMLVSSGRVSPEAAQQVGEQAGRQAAEQVIEGNLINLQVQVAGAQEEDFDYFAYIAPSMAILFLMFTVTAGGRSILAERDQGTLPRMLVSPSSPLEVLGGKVLGTFLTGMAHMGILYLATRILLGVDWGPLPAAGLLTTTLVAAATAWGILIAAYARTPGQANTVGTAISLIFAAASGNFISREVLPEWLKFASYISPNAWGLEGFAQLAAGGDLADVWIPALGLMVMAVLLFGAALVAFRRQFR